MRIDRQNYEEFFILYVDNELTSAQRLLVEEFAQKHPDLEEELVLLYQSRLTPDKNIVFEGREELLKEESNSFVDSSNYEEALLLYIDNELTTEEELQVEKFAEQNPEVKKEFKILQQTRLQPEEEIVFTSKEILYRKERKILIIPMQSWKIAAAAVLILLIGTATFFVISREQTQGEKNAVVSKNNLQTENPKVLVKNSEKKATDVKNINQERLVVKSPSADYKKENSKKQYAVNKKIINQKSQIQSKQPEISISNIPEKDIVDVRKDNMNSPVLTTNDPIANKNSSLAKDLVNPSYAAVTISNTNPSDNMNNGNKRFRGLFRKATRIFERTTKITATDEDDRLLIGGLAVKL